MTDILLINVPQISLVYPPAATSLLKGICEQHGYSAVVRDYNLELYHKCHDRNIALALDHFFSINDAESQLSSTAAEYLERYIKSVVQDVLDISPSFLGISVFTFQCQIFTKQLLDKLRPVFAGKIIVGGAGLSSNGIASAQNDFGHQLLKSGLVDFFVRGEGDQAILRILQSKAGPGINNDCPEQLDNLDAVAYPNYDDVIGLPYRYTTETPQIPITGSRGCIRKCSFCDIHVAWKKYRYRSGQNIADEMIYHHEKYDVRSFWFTDSLINGNMKSFRQFCEALVEFYNRNNLSHRYFNWGGQFVVRDNRSMTAQDFELAAAAGMNGVAMGVESLSQRVRDHMKKGFSDEDLDFTLQQIHANDMNCYFLMIVGYPTETDQDFLDGINRFVQYQKYALDGTIYGVNLGSTASIDEGTPLWHQQHELQLDAEHQNLGYNWFSLLNPTLTFRERIRRRIVLQEKLMELGYTIWNSDSQLLKLKEAYQKINDRNYKRKIVLPVPE